MEAVDVINLLSRIQGCTFASLDAQTLPTPGVRKVTTGESVILFTNRKDSGYKRMVERRLIEAGKDPKNFVLGDLAWGSRIPHTPLIEHKGSLYLQTILLRPGKSEYFLSGMNKPVDPKHLFLKERRTNQGLPPSEEVIVNTYKLSNIIRLTVLGETMT